MSVAPRVCIRHPDTPADYVCTRCGRWQCLACSKPLTEGYQTARSCSHCDGIVRIGKVAAGIESSAEALSRLISVEALMTIIALAVPAFFIGLGSIVGVILLVIYIGVLATYYYQCVDHVAAGHDGLPFSSNASDVYAIGRGFFRALIPLAIAIGPASYVSTLYLASTAHVVGALIVGVGLMPASILAGVVTREARNQLWPPVWFEIINRNARAYGKLLAAVYGTFAIWVGAYFFFEWLLQGFAIRWVIIPLIHNTCAIAQAILFGRFLQEYGPDYGVTYLR